MNAAPPPCTSTLHLHLHHRGVCTDVTPGRRAGVDSLEMIQSAPNTQHPPISSAGTPPIRKLHLQVEELLLATPTGTPQLLFLPSRDLSKTRDVEPGNRKSQEASWKSGCSSSSGSESRSGTLFSSLLSRLCQRRSPTFAALRWLIPMPDTCSLRLAVPARLQRDSALVTSSALGRLETLRDFCCLCCCVCLFCWRHQPALCLSACLSVCWAQLKTMQRCV